MKNLFKNQTIQLAIILAVILILDKIIWNLILRLNKILVYSPRFIFVTPGTFSYRIGMTLILLLILITYYFYRAFKDGELNFRGKVMYFALVILCISSFILTCVNNSVMYEDKIHYRGIRNLIGKTYSYSDIKTVRIYVSTGRGNTGVHYELIMKDKVVINLTSIEKNYKYIPKVEESIDKGVPHVISMSDYNILLHESRLPYSIYKKFTIIK